MFLFSTIRIIPGRAVPSFLSGRYSAVKVRKKLYVTTFSGEDEHTTDISNRLVRLPMYYGLRPEDLKSVVSAVREFYRA